MWNMDKTNVLKQPHFRNAGLERAVFGEMLEKSLPSPQCLNHVREDPLEIDRQPPRHSAADDIAKRMFAVPVVQGVKDRDARFRFVVPKAVAASQVEQRIAPNMGIGDGAGGNQAQVGKVRECIRKREGRRTNVMKGCFPTQPIFKVCSKTAIDLEVRNGPTVQPCKALVDSLIGHIGKCTEL